MTNHPTHIGDGVSAEPDGDGGVILRTERTETVAMFDGERRSIQIARTHWIAMDAQTWAALVAWMARMEGEQ